MATWLSLEQRLAHAWPIADWLDQRLVLAVSGGADSVAMLRAMRALAQAAARRLVVAHFNHGWRGAESDADATFVRQLCHTLQIELVVGQPPSQSAAPSGDGLEAAARQQRYEFLRQTAEERGARYVVTAHTADDQAETILHHILRGTGLGGLSGIPRTRVLSPAVTVVRPLLEASRQEIVDYLAELAQPYRVDASNECVAFMRNRIRHELLPLLERDYAPGVRRSLLRLGALAADAQKVVEQAACAQLERSISRRTEQRVDFDCQMLAGVEKHVVREMLVLVWRQQGWPLQAMTFSHWNLLAETLLQPAAADNGTSAKSKFVLPGAVIANREANCLSLTKTSAG